MPACTSSRFYRPYAYSYAPAYAYKPDQLPEILDETTGKGSNFTSSMANIMGKGMLLKSHLDDTKEERQAIGVAIGVGVGICVVLGIAAMGHGGSMDLEQICFN